MERERWGFSSGENEVMVGRQMLDEKGECLVDGWLADKVVIV